MILLFVMDLGTVVYDSVLAVVNYICFASLILCCLYIYLAATIGQIAKVYKQAAVVAFIWVCILIGMHSYSVNYLGIPILVPPIGTPYFEEFLHVVQFIMTLAVLLLFGFFAIMALLKQLSSEFGKHAFSALIFLIFLVGLHVYISAEFGVPLIFPPGMWG